MPLLLFSQELIREDAQALQQELNQTLAPMWDTVREERSRVVLLMLCTPASSPGLPVATCRLLT